jgi:hypothetical protein
MTDVKTENTSQSSLSEFASKLALYDGESFNPLSVLVILLVIVLAAIPFIRNYKYCDNHLNWLNHDYAKNLMISTEKDSVLMTEGGDNQVFGTLYFIYAEKLRPDISPYDQMGNIFKRIYGDMRYVSGDIVDRRKKMVDTGIFDGQEPFYVQIRDSADPYFVPYWQGRRPVYLTWQRPNQWTLGDVYYKRYGMMYKVQDIEYSLVDYLEIKREIPLSDAAAQFSRQLNRQVTMEYTVEKVNKLVKEGWLRMNGGNVEFVKMYPLPHNSDYLQAFVNHWKEAKNVQYWDTLSREIVIGYGTQMGDIFKQEANGLKELRSRETRKDQLADIDRRIQENWNQAKEFYEMAINYGGDSLTALYSVSMALMNNGFEDMTPRVKEMLAKSINLYRNFWGGYSVMFQILFTDSYKNPANEPQNVKDIERYLNQLKKQLSYYRSAHGNYANNQLWANFSWVEQHLAMMKQVPNSQLIPLANMMLEQLKTGKAASIDNNNAQQAIFLLYFRGLPFQYKPFVELADALFDGIVAAKANDAGFQNWAFGIASQLGKPAKAVAIGNRIDAIQGGKVDPGFLYNMGMLSGQAGDNPAAKLYLNRFLDSLKDNRKAALEMREQIENARKTLAALK